MDKTLEEFRLRIAHAQIDSEQIEQDLWDARQRIAALEAEGERLREALSIYADPVNWIYEEYIGPETAYRDGGDIARAALEPTP